MEQKKPSDREQFSLRISEKEKKDLEKLAYANNSSLNNYIIRLIKKEISQE